MSKTPLKGKASAVPVALVLAAAVAVFLAFLILPGIFETNGLYRGGFNTVKNFKKTRLEFPGFDIEKEPGSRFVTIQLKGPRYENCFTLKGAVLRSPRGKRKLKVKAPESGRYIMDFFCFFPSMVNGRATALLESGGDAGGGGKPAVLARLTVGNTWKRYQVAMDLQKNRQPLFSLEGPGIIMFSDPVFYRVNDYRKKKKLVFVISVDTLRQDHVGVYNPAMRCTPVIDALARDAVVFRNAYSSSSWTLPAHVSLFTGTFAYRHDLNYKSMKNGARLDHTLFAPLREKFITVSFNGGVFLSHLFGFARDFDIYHEARKDCDNPKAASYMFRKTREFLETDLYNAPALFFLHTYQVHSRFSPEQTLARDYFKDAPNKYKTYEMLNLTKKGRDQYKTNVAPEERKEIIKTYNAGIYTFDRRFGEFLDFLKKRELYDDALIVLLSDHGEAFMDHGGWEHGHSLYNELIKIPLLVKFPGNRWAGRDVTGTVSIIDILPTLLEMEGCGIGQENSDINGQPLFQAITQEKGPFERSVVSYLAPYACSRTPMKTAIVSGDFKFIFNREMTVQDIGYFLTPPPPIESLELYDLVADHLEQVNVRNKHKGLLAAFLKQFRELKINRSIRKFPEKIKNRLKQMGYLN